MKYFLVILICLLSPTVFAADNGKDACFLENKVFCGDWKTWQGLSVFKIKITGKDIWFEGFTHMKCTPIDEAVRDDRPYSILKCSYTMNGKKYTSYEMFSYMDYGFKTEQGDLGEAVFHSSADNIPTLFQDYIADDKKEAYIKRFADGYLQRKRIGQ